MNRFHELTVGITTLTLLGLVACSDSAGGDRARTESLPPDESLSSEDECPSPYEATLEDAIGTAKFPLALPSHEFASSANVQEVCLDPSGRVILRFPSPRPAQEPLRADGLTIVEGWWYAGDPMTEFEARLASYPEDVGKEIHSINGLPALSDPPHDDETGLDRAYLTLVLGRGVYLELTGDGNGVEIEMAGGESVEDLIAIAKTLEIITH
jgi:hypothetical protein